ncbi:Aspartic proteinase A1 isoform 1 [Hibiscus syriacus]|uniref:Aspartic proteinase A1 isoform 1 n=1 Tax=Hibiscus syriacus TaxID=106335 RepID=A0A6A2YPF4_HIBSY|nr:Aspartic proteinase A1 isoform 1 [Hibiscus syriacus]
MRSDNARLQTIARRMFPRRKNVQVKMWQSNNLVELPIRSAADIGTGQYFVSFRIGSPPRKFIMIIDTGSSLTWMKCKYKCKGCSRIGLAIMKGYLMPKHHVLGRHESARILRQRYGHRTPHRRRKVKVPEVMIGCSETIMGEFHDIDGVMGLGFEWHSFALKAARKFGYKFSYCLVDHLSPSNLVNFLVFGDANDPTTPKLQYTELILGIVNPYYAVNVSGISIDGKMLKIPSHVWDIRSGGGVIVDSGCSLTQLVRPVFDRVVAAFKAPLSKFKKLSIGSEGPDICFDDTGYKESMMPKLVIHFADGAKLTPQ